MNRQQLLVILALAVSINFLYQKFFGKKKPKKNCDKDDCGCN